MIKKLSSVIFCLVVLQIVISVIMVGKKIGYESSLPLWLNPDHFMFEKVQVILGRDYYFASTNLPTDANILLVSNTDKWFVNYYLFPRKLYSHEGATQEIDVKHIPPAWLNQRKIDYIFYFSPPQFRFEKRLSP